MLDLACLLDQLQQPQQRGLCRWPELRLILGCLHAGRAARLAPPRACLLYTMAHIAVAWPHIWPAAMHKRFFYYCALIKCKYFYSLGFSWAILYCNPHYIAAIFSKHIYSQRFVRRWVRRKKFSPSLINCLTLKL